MVLFVLYGFRAKCGDMVKVGREGISLTCDDTGSPFAVGVFTLSSKQRNSSCRSVSSSTISSSTVVSYWFQSVRHRKRYDY